MDEGGADGRASADGRATGGSAARRGTPASPGPGGYRGLRELQRELESLKLSLSVYLGPGLR